MLVVDLNQYHSYQDLMKGCNKMNIHDIAELINIEWDNQILMDSVITTPTQRYNKTMLSTTKTIQATANETDPAIKSAKINKAIATQNLARAKLQKSNRQKTITEDVSSSLLPYIFAAFPTNSSQVNLYDKTNKIIGYAEKISRSIIRYYDNNRKIIGQRNTLTGVISDNNGRVLIIMR